MKILIALAVVQTALLLILVGKLVLVDDEPAVAPRTEQSSFVSDDYAYDQSPGYSYESGTQLDEYQLRQIIREELAALSDSGIGAGSQADAAVALSAAEIAEREYQRDQVAQQLNYHTSVGSISDMDMQKLQMEIAKLDAAGRTKMLRELTRALNSGSGLRRDLPSPRIAWRNN